MSRSLPRGRRLVVVLCAVALVTAVLGYVALGRPSSSPSDSGAASSAHPDTSPAPGSGADSAADAIGRVDLRRFDDPLEFARAVASTLFVWDTTSGVSLSELSGQLMAVADPTGGESVGLVADLAAYLPTAETWDFLQDYETHQWLEIDDVFVPDGWYQALDEPGADGFAPGTVAMTVDGTRHRAGVWEGEPVSSAHSVSFSAFVVCAPTYEHCRLLRLSRLGEALE